MKKILENCGCPAEFLMSNGSIDELNFQENELQSAESKQVVGKAVRIIRDGRIGTTIGGVSDTVESLLDTASLLSRHGRTAEFTLPEGSGEYWEESFDSSKCVNLSIQEMMDAGKDLVARFKAKLPEWSIHLKLCSASQNQRLINSKGVDWAFNTRGSYFYSVLVNPREGDILELFDGREDLLQGEDLANYINELSDIARHALHTVEVDSGEYPLLIHPMTLSSFLQSFDVAVNATGIHEGLSPLKDRIGEQIFDPRISILDDPLNREMSGYSPMGEEGVKMSALPLVEKGMLRNFLSDLEYSAKTGLPHTGHGQRFPGCGSSDRPSPESSIGATNVVIAQGDDSYENMFHGMKEGIYLLGTHDMWSGTLINGDVSGSTNLAFWVRDGEIVGRVKDMRISGNIYDLFGKQLAAVSRERPSQFNSSLKAPFILVNDVTLA